MNFTIGEVFKSCAFHFSHFWWSFPFEDEFLPKGDWESDLITMERIVSLGFTLLKDEDEDSNGGDFPSEEIDIEEWSEVCWKILALVFMLVILRFGEEGEEEEGEEDEEEEKEEEEEGVWSAGGLVNNCESKFLRQAKGIQEDGEEKDGRVEDDGSAMALKDLGRLIQQKKAADTVNWKIALSTPFRPLFLDSRRNPGILFYSPAVEWANL